MVTNQDLADAAIALSRILTTHNVKFGLFGEYAVSLLGGPRSCAKLDCRVAADQATLLRLLDSRGGFRAAAPLMRENGTGALGMLWNSRRDEARASTVWVRFRCDESPGTPCFSVPFLGPFACLPSRRRWVRPSLTVGTSRRGVAQLHPRARGTGELTLRTGPGELGRAIQRHASLENTFAGFGMDVASARELVASRALDRGSLDDAATKKRQFRPYGVSQRTSSGRSWEKT